MGWRHGLGSRRKGFGPPRYCICPNCGTVIEHKPGIPCRHVKCPKCGTPMVGERCRVITK